MPRAQKKKAQSKAKILTGYWRQLVACIVVFSVAGVILYQSNASAAAPTVNSANTRAALAVAQLHSWFNPATYNTAGWWQSANAVGATIDYMQETGSRAYLGDVQAFYAAHSSTNFIINKYYDDEGWWALTWIKAYRLTGNTAYLNTAKAIFTNMTGGWDNTCGGGMWWTTDKTYKNAIPNELFLDISTQLHQVTPGDTSYLNWANKEATWFLASGMLTSSHLVVDGLSSTCAPLVSPANTWTYNQGVILGGLVNLYNITGTSSYLATANAIAGAVISSSALSPKGILTEQCEPKGNCSSDNAMFKGIFMQNLGVLYKQTNMASYGTYLQLNANSVWNNDRANGEEFGLHWAGPFDSADAVREASALDLFNTLVTPNTALQPTAAVTVYSGLNGLCLDDWHDSAVKNNKVDLFPCNGTVAQNWKVATNGTIQIAGQCVDLYQANTANGGLVDLYPCNGGHTQQWQLQSDGSLYNTYAGKCLDDPAASTVGGTQLQIWACNGNKQQVWYTSS
jgi:predicted alpha-1,6-mannanase (GH76 family)